MRRSLWSAALGAAFLALSTPGQALARGLHADPNRSLAYDVVE